MTGVREEREGVRKPERRDVGKEEKIKERMGEREASTEEACEENRSDRGRQETG